MNLSLLDLVLWATGFAGHVALALILIFRRRVRTFPLFTSYIVFQIITTAALFTTYRLATAKTYAAVYWCGAAIDFTLLVGVIAGIAFAVLRPSRIWAQNSRSGIISLSLLGLLIALGLALWVHPPSLTSAGAWETRGNLFTSMMTCEIFTAVLLVSQRLGYHWRSHVMTLGYGLTAWALTCFVVEGLHAYWGDLLHFNALEYTRKFVYLGTLAFWITTFWRNEPKKKQPSAEMQERLLHLTDKVSYDLAKALGTRGKEFR